VPPFLSLRAVLILGSFLIVLSSDDDDDEEEIIARTTPVASTSKSKVRLLGAWFGARARRFVGGGGLTSILSKTSTLRFGGDPPFSYRQITPCSRVCGSRDPGRGAHVDRIGASARLGGAGAGRLAPRRQKCRLSPTDATRRTRTRRESACEHNAALRSPRKTKNGKVRKVDTKRKLTALSQGVRDRRSVGGGCWSSSSSVVVS
jgi:hypothetical protein